MPPRSELAPTLTTTKLTEMRWAVIVVGIAALAVVSPFFFLGNASGHDFDFHVASWMDVAHQWREGVLFPRWAEWANFGFGEPRFIFYPPLSWILGAALGTVLPWRAVPGALIWIFLLTAGMGAYRLSREWLGPAEAIAAAVFYAANPYHLVIVYYRSAFAELLASVIFPFAVLAALRIGERRAKALPHLAVAFALVWLSNAPAAVIITYALLLLLLVVSIVERSFSSLLWGAAAMATGLGLAAFYLIPAAWEQKWVQIQEVLAAVVGPEKNFLFSTGNDPEFVLFNWKVSSVAVGILLVTVLAAIAVNRWRKRMPELWWPLASLGILSTLMLLPVSLPLWNALPKLRFVQFPWRWLIVLDLVFAVFLALATSGKRGKWIWRSLIGALLIVSAILMVRDAWWDSDEVDDLAAAVISGKGYEGVDEYQPIGSDRRDLPSLTAKIRLETGESQAIGGATGTRIHVERWSAEEKIFLLDSAHPERVALRLLDYPAWRAEVNGTSTAIHARAGTAQMELAVPAGHNRVELRFTRTIDRRAGDAISIVTAFSLLCFLLAEHRRKRQQEGTPVPATELGL